MNDQDKDLAPGAGLVSGDGLTPDVEALLAELDDAGITDTDFLTRLRDNEDVRFCFWAGQSDDGRKHAAAIGAEAHPWEGASDTRVRVTDMVIREATMTQMAAYRRGRLQVTARGADDFTRAHNADESLRYMTGTLMGGEAEDELEYAADWRATYGLSILEVGWLREEQLVEATANVEQLEALAAEAGLMQAMEKEAQAGGELTEAEARAVVEESTRELRDMLFDPRHEETVLTLLQGWSPAVDRRTAQRMLRELKHDGRTVYPVPEKTVDRAQWTALLPMVDVFFPSETCRIQDARWVARAEWLSASQIRNRIVTEGWDEDFVERCLQNKGVSFDGTAGALATGGMHGMNRRRASGWRVEDYSEMTQVLHVYYKVPIGPQGARAGRVGVFRTVLHPSVKDAFGKHEQSRFSHGKYPFIAMTREKTDRRLLESRGIPEITKTWQGEIKKQRDSRFDRTDLATLPPLVKPQNWGGGSVRLGPASQVPERRANTVRWLNPPPFDSGAVEAERTVAGEIDQYFGRHAEGVSPVLSALHSQHLVDGFLSGVREVMRMTFQLMQQYMPPVWIQRVGGVAEAGPVEVTRQDIQGQFDFELSFDARDLDVEFVTKKLELIATLIVPLDTAAVVDRGTLVQWAMRAIDPQLAQMVVRSTAAAQADEVEDEKRNVAMMASGVEPIMRTGQDHATRLQVLQETIAANPELRRYLGEDPAFAAMVEARAQHHQHQLDQEENKLIGVMGARPALQQQE